MNDDLPNDDVGERSEERAHAALLSSALKTIRLRRRMRTSEVASAMGLATRTYEHFEAGTGKMSYSRISKFAEVTDSDPVAILSVIPLRSPAFAAACAENKLMTVVMACMREIDQELGVDVALLPTSILISAFDQLGKDLVAQVRRRDEFTEKWIREKAAQIEGAGFLGGKQEPSRKR